MTRSYGIAEAVAEEQRLHRLDRWRRYRKLHNVCPTCGSGDVLTTCVGYTEPPNMNRATCRCGWKGRVDDLVAKTSPEVTG